ncbi:hypothetical protein ACTSKR_07045 [Chitinibacteraceae bacterium HSL-7]
MDRVAFIEKFSASTTVVEGNSFIHALTRCLSPDEAVGLLQRSLDGSSTLRTAALRKVCADIANKRLPGVSELIADLEQKIESGNPRKRQGYAYCLLEIARAADADNRIRAQTFLSSSKYVGLRRRGYKLYDQEAPRSRTILEQAWRNFGDPEAAWIMVKSFPLSTLLEEKSSFLAVLSEGWQRSKLFLRLAELDQKYTDDLLELDPISFVYVKAKLGQQVSADILNTVLENSLGDDRIGLLLWSLGELKQWDQLVAASSRTKEMAEARFGQFSASGI